MKVEELIVWSERNLARAGHREAAREARLILAAVLGETLSGIVMWSHRGLEGDLERKVRAWTCLRAKGVPLQYVVGEAGFFGHVFRVQPGVFIPRPETELLVESVVDDAALGKSSRVLDVGTGTGCVAISIKLRKPDFDVVGCDISRLALMTAAGNAMRLGAEVRLLHVDRSLETLGGLGQFDVIVSNPPYVPHTEISTLPVEVLHEPIAATRGLVDAVATYKTFARAAAKLLRANGKVVIEIHEGDAAIVVRILEDARFHSVQIRRDLNGRDRIVEAEWGRASIRGSF